MAERQQQLTQAQLDILQKYPEPGQVNTPPSDALTEGQRNILSKYEPQLTPIEEFRSTPATYPPLSGTLRMGLQGATFGFGEEIEAMIRAAIPGGPGYEEQRDQLRQEIAKFREDYPGTAITAEVVGAIATNFVPAVAAVRSGNLAKTSMSRLVGVGTGEGALYGLGTSEKDSAGQTVMDVGEGAFYGFAAPLAVVGGPRAALGIFNKVGNFLTERFGTRYSDTVSAYLNALAQQMGKSVDEIVADMAEGKMITDNETANAAIKSFITEGGEGANILLQYIRDRAKSTTAEATSTVRSALAPGKVEDVFNAYLDDIERLQQKEKDAYKVIFKKPEYQQTTPEIADTVEIGLQRFSEARDQLKKLYEERNLVPLFSEAPDGAITLTRAPTVEDAEMVYRQIRDAKNALFRDGYGARGQVYAEYANNLKNQLDNTYEDLANTRAGFRQQELQQEAFDEGLASLGKNVDLTARMMRGYDAEQLIAFRAGVFSAIRDKLRRSQTTIANLADEDKQLGDLLRLVAPEESLDDLDRSLNIAAEARRTAQAMPNRAGSQTEILRRQRQREVSLPVSGQELRAAVAGDPVAILNVSKKAVSSLLGDVDISQADRDTIAQILVSEDPDMLINAMVNENFAEKLNAKIAQYAKTIAPNINIQIPTRLTRLAEQIRGGAPTAATQQSIGLLGGSSATSENQ